MVKRLLRLFYRFCDSLDRKLFLWCEYEKHQAQTKSYLEALKQQPIPFYAGPHDGGFILYAGLVVYLPDHQDGAYCFDGEQYKWTVDSTQSGVSRIP